MTNNLFDLKKILLIFVISLISIFLYDFQIQAMNQRLGMKYIVYDFTNILILIFNLLIVYILLNNKLKPSIIFTNVLLLFVILPFFLFLNLNGNITLEMYLYYLLLLFLPILITRLYLESIIKYFIKLEVDNYFFKIELNIEKLLLFILIVTFFLVNLKLDLKFSFYDSYVRRIESREILVGYLGYLFSISMNGIAPYLSFLAVMKKNYKYLLLSIIFTIICFGFIGVKAPLFYVCLFSFIALILKNYKINFNKLFSLLVLSIFIFAFIEYVILDFSWIADIIIRRIHPVVAQNQLYFLDFFIYSFDTKNILFGLSPNITYIIGDIYHTIPKTNANVNGILYEIGRNGLFGYFIMILLLVFLFSLLDYLYEKYNMKEFLAISILYSILLIEQSYSTALISSGILFIILLTIFTKKENYE